MSDFLYSIDKAVFFFINRTISNPVLDWLMPFLTDLNKHKVTIAVVAVLWLWLMVKGGKDRKDGRNSLGAFDHYQRSIQQLSS